MLAHIGEPEGPESAANITQPALFSGADLSPETLLAGLNPEQQAAVRCTDAPLLIVAGPGTGKTRTLTTRIAYLVTAHGVAPENILAITFTNKAAGEMAERLEKLLGGDVASRLTIKTFHAFGLMLLRETAAEIGLPPNFAICSEPERLALLKRVYPETSSRDLERLLDAISTAKSRLLTPDDLSDGGEDKKTSNHENLQSPISNLPTSPQFSKTYRRYETALAQNQLLDFDDLVLRPVQLLEGRSDLLDRYRQRFRWLSVDEYQDINLAQYRLLRLLAGPDNNLCAIGDPDQAIYGFRGADRRYFLSFAQDFPEAKTLSLSRNYRSTQLILDASGQVIRRNPGGQAHELRSDIIDPAKVDIYRAPTDKAEAEYIVHQIEQRVGGTSYFSIDSGRVDDEGPSGRTFADFAVLYRLGAQRGPLLEAFERSGIPFQTAGQASLYEQKPIRRLLAYLWFAYNPNARLYLETILGPKSPASTQKLLDRLAALAEAQQRTLGAVVQDFATLDFLSGSERKRLANIAPLLAEVQQAVGQTPLARLVEQVGARLGLAADEPLLRRLVLRAAPFEQRLADFLESTVLHKETDFYDPRADRVALLTLHAAKGLEFPVVFIVGCEEGLLPYEMQGRPVDLAEERRLFYVGMTRAQERLILTHAGSRFLFGERQENAPSRFVDDIEAALKALKEAPRRPVEARAESRQLKLF